jgi:hypothetical protein
MSFPKSTLGRVIFGIIVLFAGWIGVQSLVENVLPQSGFSLLTEIQQASSTATSAFVQYSSAATPRPAPKIKKEKPAPQPAPDIPIAEIISSTPPLVAPPPSSTPPLILNPEPTIVSAPPQIVTPTSSSIVLISEVFTGSEVSGDDEFIELYNPGQQSIDLTGWYINKKTASGKEDNLVARARFQNKNIFPGQYFLLVHDGSSFGGGAPDLIWAKSNTLAAKNNTIILYNASAVKVDEASWAEIPRGGSYARTTFIKDASFSVQGSASPRR